jgi:hypothetical protein
MFGVTVCSPDYYQKDTQKKQVLIASRNDHGTTTAISKTLDEYGCVKDTDYTSLYRFAQNYYLLGNNELYLDSGTLIITSNCALKCNGCYMGLPYRNKNFNRPFNEIKNDIDLFFSTVDYSLFFNISGGDALLHPDIEKIVEYVGKNYRNRIASFGVLTTGMVLPHDLTLRICKSYNVTIGVSDYSAGIPEEKYSRKLHAFFKKIKSQNVMLSVSREWDNNKWINVGNPTFKRGRNLYETKELFKVCGIQYTNYFYDGKIFHCPMSAGLNLGMVQDTDSDDCFSLPLNISYGNTDKKKELILFDMGYIAKGYLNACFYCDGMGAANKNRITPGTQL